MSFLKSILFGCEGSYNIFGMPVKFESELPSHLAPPGLERADLISQLARKSINNVSSWVIQGYTLVAQVWAHTFVHEMSHALAYKILTGKNAEVYLYRGGFVCGRTVYPPEGVNLVDWERTIINIAGPLGNIAF